MEPLVGFLLSLVKKQGSQHLAYKGMAKGNPNLEGVPWWLLDDQQAAARFQAGQGALADQEDKSRFDKTKENEDEYLRRRKPQMTWGGYPAENPLPSFPDHPSQQPVPMPEIGMGADPNAQPVPMPPMTEQMQPVDSPYYGVPLSAYPTELGGYAKWKPYIEYLQNKANRMNERRGNEAGVGTGNEMFDTSIPRHVPFGDANSLWQEQGKRMKTNAASKDKGYTKAQLNKYQATNDYAESQYRAYEESRGTEKKMGGRKWQSGYGRDAFTKNFSTWFADRASSLAEIPEALQGLGVTATQRGARLLIQKWYESNRALYGTSYSPRYDLDSESPGSTGGGSVSRAVEEIRERIDSVHGEGGKIKELTRIKEELRQQGKPGQRILEMLERIYK